MNEKNVWGTLNNGRNKGHKKDENKNNELEELIVSLVSEAVKNERDVWEKEFEQKIVSEREDAARLATMSADDRAKAEIEKKQKAFETEREQYVSERAEFEAAKELAKQNLPVNFAHMLSDSDREKMLEKIASFKAEYMKAIENALSERLRGTAPRISRREDNVNDPFLNGLGM